MKTKPQYVIPAREIWDKKVNDIFFKNPKDFYLIGFNWLILIYLLLL